MPCVIMSPAFVTSASLAQVPANQKPWCGRVVALFRPDILLRRGLERKLKIGQAASDVAQCIYREGRGEAEFTIFRRRELQWAEI